MFDMAGIFFLPRRPMAIPREGKVPPCRRPPVGHFKGAEPYVDGVSGSTRESLGRYFPLCAMQCSVGKRTHGNFGISVPPKGRSRTSSATSSAPLCYVKPYTIAGRSLPDLLRATPCGGGKWPFRSRPASTSSLFSSKNATSLEELQVKDQPQSHSQ